VTPLELGDEVNGARAPECAVLAHHLIRGRRGLPTEHRWRRAVLDLDQREAGDDVQLILAGREDPHARRLAPQGDPLDAVAAVAAEPEIGQRLVQVRQWGMKKVVVAHASRHE
jgi:ATP phosphoribosyltransferase